MEKVSVGRSVRVNDDNFIFCRRTYTVKQLTKTVYVDIGEGGYFHKELNLYLSTFKSSRYHYTLQTGDVIDVIQECFQSDVSRDKPKVCAFDITVNGLSVASRESYAAILTAFEKTVRYIEGLE
jgi:hypothetical protein